MKHLVATLFLAGVLMGCAAQHPGAVNTFDNTTYNTLLVTHSVIESTKADLTGNVFPINVAPKVKAALNGLISAYDIADNAYVAYHNSAVAGKATTAQLAEVNLGLQNISTATDSLVLAKAGK